MQPHLDLFWQGQQRGTTDASRLADGSGADIIGLDDGLRLQLAVLDRWRGQGEVLGGWKVGLTSGQSRDNFGPGIRPFGYILRSRIFASGATIAIASVPNLGLETEVCFRIGTRLSGAAVTAAEARAAVAAVMPAFELNQKRTDGSAGAGVRTADNLSQWGIVIGAEQPVDALGDPEAMVVTQHLDGALQETVHARGHIDDHFASLATLARELSRFDLALDAGMHVITGAYTRANKGIAGTYVGTFTGLGEVRVTFA
jgi:2-keto-4-pentenoate hydratase